MKKAQEKLTVDLEQCISRRDNILDVALAKEKRMSSAKASYTREQFNKKLETIRQKIKQLQTVSMLSLFYLASYRSKSCICKYCHTHQQHV